MKSQKIALFVDVQNLFYSAKFHSQSKVDYSRLVAGVVNGREVVIANAYVIQRADLDNKQVFYDMLKHLGLNVKSKEFLPPRDASRDPRSPKESWIGQMTIDMLYAGDKVDTIVLVSGDAEHADLAAFLASNGIRLEVHGIKDTIAGTLSKNAAVVHVIPEEWTFKEKKFLAQQTSQPQHSAPKKFSAPSFAAPAFNHPLPNFDEVQPIVPNQPTANSDILS